MIKSELITPSVIIDIDILRKNISVMADRAKRAGVKLRPHVKTHKIPEIARMQMKAGAAGITCAKASEAEVMVRAGIRDILIAFPLIGEKQIEMIMKMSRKCRITVAFDSLFGAERINEAARKYGCIIPLYMIVNTGLNRDGVGTGEEALMLALRTSGLESVHLKGIMTHEGHVYEVKKTDEVTRIASEAGQKVVEISRLLSKNGFQAEEVSVGSTPTCREGSLVEGVTEWRPGTYVFNDAIQLSLGSPLEDCALSVLGTVVSHPAPDRYILDTGSKTLAADKLVSGGYGYIRGMPSAVIERLSEEHGVVRVKKDGHLQIGQRVEIIPSHVCTAINLTDKVYVCSGEEVVYEWEVEARGKVR